MPRSGTGSFEAAAFAAAVLLLLVPVWVFDVFATQDGPAHLYNAWLITELLAGQATWFDDWIVLNDRMDPTWFPHLLLAGLIAHLPVDFAEKLYQSASVVMLPAAARYVLRGLGSRTATWAWLSLPMAYSFAFHLGFYSFCLGLSLSMLMLGYWLRNTGRWRLRVVLTQGGLALAAYFAHVFAFLTFGIAMFVPACLRLWDTARKRDVSTAFFARFLPWTSAFAPALLLAGEFLLARQSEYVPLDIEWRLKALLQFSALQAYADVEALQSMALAGVLLAASIAGFLRLVRARDTRAAAWAASMLLLFVMAVFVPDIRMISDNDMQGGGYFIPRIGVIFYLCSLVFIAAALGAPKYPRVVIGLGLALTVLGFGLRLPYYLEIQQQLREYHAADSYVHAGDLVLALNVQQGTFLPEPRNATILADPLLHEVNRIAVRNKAFSWNNYQANIGYFPIQYTEGVNPLRFLGRLEVEPPDVDIAAFERRLGRGIDVILLWYPASRRVDGTVLLANIDAAGFDRVHVSAPKGLMWVYRRSERADFASN